MKQFIQHVKCK